MNHDIRFLKKNRIFVLMGTLTLLQACSMFAPIKTCPVHYYAITAVPPSHCVRYDHLSCPTVLVNQPQANGIYASTRMIYRPDTYQLQYFAKSRWEDTPAHMLHALLVRTLQNTGHFQVVLDTASTTHYDWILNTQLFSFQQEFLTQASTFRVVLQAQLIDAHTDRIVATQNFLALATAPINNPHGGVIAANIATQNMLRDVAQFCVLRTRLAYDETRRDMTSVM